MKKRMKFTSIIVSLIMILQICFANLCPASVHAAGSQMISFVYNDFSNAAMNKLLYLQSDAKIAQGKKGKTTINQLRLTSSARQLKGSAFYTRQVSVSSNKSFSTFFTFKMIPGTRADGIVFVLNDNTKNIGKTGSAIGYGGILNSIGIEFDTFENHGYDSTNGIDGLDDPNDNHLGINVDGDPRSKVTLNLHNIGIDLADGNEKYAWIDYNGQTNQLEVRINRTNTRPQDASLAYTINISQYLKSDDVYAGFTAATGGSYEEHDIDSWYFDSKYNPIDITKNTYINAPTTVTVNADKTSGVTDTTPVHVNVKNADGTNASNISVTLSTDYGTFDGYTVTTDENGNGIVNFNVNDTTSGTASIKAVAEGGAFGTCSIGYLGIPKITNGTKNGTGDTTMNFLPEDFISNYNGDAIKSINIESLPGHGSLEYNGQPVKVKDNILISNVNFLSFAPDMYFNGPTSFQWSAVSKNDQCSNIATETLNFSPVNHAPNAPGNFTVLLSGRDFKGGTVLPLSWGQATDPDNDPLNYIVEFYNGTSWIQIYEGSNLNCSYTLPAAVSLDNAQFRVEAVDPGKLYSPYTNSDLFKLDNSSPVITLNGASPITVEVNNDYTDLGATASDNFDGDITSGILVKNNVKADTVGTYTVEYTVTDTAGNTSTVTRTVYVKDTTSPIIALKGKADITVEVFSSYTDEGATATDNYDADISSRIVTTGTVDTSVVRDYVLTYNVTDAYGNKAEPVTRTVHVVDTIKPVVKLIGDPFITLEVGSSLSDPGATASDNYDGDISGKIVADSNVITDKLGFYTITYAVEDSSGNLSDMVTRTVHVVDTTRPVIALNGQSEITIEVNSIYSDEGVSASDNYDGDLSHNAVAVSDLQTDKVGRYTISYYVADSSGNISDTVTRTINVVDTIKPVITLKGDSEITLEVHSAYTEPGASALDNYDGDISGKIVIQGTVNMDTLGDNKITYNVTDTSGNPAVTVTRIVHVVDTTKPFITLKGGSEITLEVHSAYTEPGASAFDNYDGDISGKIVIQGTVNMDTLGDNKITYNVTDTSQNEAVTVTRTVHVVDTIKPVIMLKGDPLVTIGVHNAYKDAGASASDNYDGDLSKNIEVKNNVDADKLGEYTVTYNVSDSSGNKADTVTRTVRVVDTTKPVITLKGDPLVTIGVHNTYKDEGASASDNYDGDLSEKIEVKNTVDTEKLGEYTVTYNVSDSSGNKADTVTRTVRVIDAVKPVITLNGSSSVTIEVHSTYMDDGATAIDNYDGIITQHIVATGTVNTDKLGDYTISYDVTDSSGNKAVTVTRTVHVVDTTKPFITLKGESEITLEVHSTYTEPGASAFDNYDGDISGKIVIQGTVNMDKLGDNKITYNVTDTSQNAAVTVTRTIHVVDTTKPLITLKGNQLVEAEVHSTYVDAGASASDNYDGDLSKNIEVKNNVDTDKLGEYTVTYNVSDSSGNKADTVTRTVRVVDTTKPVITLKGDPLVTIGVHNTYKDEGASASDNYEGDISGKIETKNNVDTDKLGEYTVTYNVSDSSGNKADTVTRTVRVIDAVKPVITLNGSSSVIAEVHSTYVDDGATAIDNYDGIITSRIVATGTVDTDKLGEYPISYDVTDSSGNKAVTVTRTVKVVDTTKPFITLKGESQITLEVHSSYTDAGASAHDNYDGDISGKIITAGTVNIDKLGDYPISYDVTDSSGNKAVTVMRTVHVVDTTKPVITLKGTSSVTTEAFNGYYDPGAAASDNYDGNISGKIVATGTVNTEKTGEYTISYNVTDSSGNKADTVTRTINVTDTIKPVITLKGNSSVIVEVHSTYKDNGASATDNYDGDITGKIVISGTVNTDKLGDYILTYNVTDSYGNKAVTVTRTVHVVDTTKPVITLKGETPVTIEIHSSYKDAGASAMDNYDGNISGSILTIGTVNTEKAGDYTISYNVMDSSGNKADTVTRIVHVTDTSKPVGSTNQANTPTLQTGSVFNFDTLIIIAAMFMIIGGVCFFKKKRTDF